MLGFKVNEVFFASPYFPADHHKFVFLCVCLVDDLLTFLEALLASHIFNTDLVLPH